MAKDKAQDQDTEAKPKAKKAEGGKKPSGGRKPEASAPALEIGPDETGPRPRLLDYYNQKAVPALSKEFGFKNPHQVPRLVKIVINVGMGEAQKTPKLMEAVVVELGQITGQKPVVTRAKKAISNFGLRKGSAIGAQVTLRGPRMYEFLDRFVNVTLPRVRDFRGIPTRSFDGQGNYTLGVKEQMIFPEIDYDKVEKIHGMDITFVTTAGRDDLALALLRQMGMPFRGQTPVAAG
jgi:large subunit ribosomal protein L5